MDVDEDSSDDEDFDIVNVDFEWFNFDAEVDFHGIKNLLRQLFDVDQDVMDCSTLSDLIISQNTVGSTVKVDTKENDPYAFLTVLNLKEHKDNQAVQDFVKYLSQKAQENPALAQIPSILQTSHVGLLLSERLINMPSEISPPLYAMIVDEIEAAVEDKEPYDFSHYLIVSKTYHEVESTLDKDEQKRKKAKPETPLFYFHPEDEVMQKHALAYGSYPFTKDGETVSDSKRAFQEAGVKPMGFMILVEAAKFPQAVKAIGEYMGGSSN